jgi:hypothetical protein
MQETIVDLITGEITVVDVPAEEVAARIAAAEAAEAAIPYTEKRAAEYPSYADQFDLLYHGGYDAWKAAIDAVKTKYPKPEQT